MIRSTHRRGRHKVFIGMAPGVGKTCRMLQEGKEMLREGTDVVVGLLETHGRLETARQAEGLEQIPRKQLRYQDVDLEGMDVGAGVLLCMSDSGVSFIYAHDLSLLVSHPLIWRPKFIPLRLF